RTARRRGHRLPLIQWHAVEGTEATGRSLRSVAEPSHAVLRGGRAGGGATTAPLGGPCGGGPLRGASACRAGQLSGRCREPTGAGSSSTLGGVSTPRALRISA